MKSTSQLLAIGLRAGCARWPFSVSYFQTIRKEQLRNFYGTQFMDVDEDNFNVLGEESCGNSIVGEILGKHFETGGSILLLCLA